jgi:hypothetical protein
MGLVIGGRARYAATLLNRLGLAVLVIALSAGVGCRRAAGPEIREAGLPVVLVVIDGLRLDYATPELMPSLNRLGANGVVFGNHHAVFPAKAAPNAVSILTGVSPGSHGVPGERFLVPQVSRQAVEADDAAALRAMDAATGGRLIRALTLGERVEGMRRNFLAVTNGSPGLAYLLGYGANPREGGSAVVSPAYRVPAGIGQTLETNFGVTAPSAESDSFGDRWAVQAFLALGAEEPRPAISILWLAGPHRTQQESGVGSPGALAAVRSVDAALGELLYGLEARGLLNRTHLIVTGSRGFAPEGVGESLDSWLIRNGMRRSPDSEDIVAVGDEIFVFEGGEAVRRALVEHLLAEPWVAAVFTRASRPGPDGALAGTFSYSPIQREGERAGTLYVSRREGLDPGRASAAGGGGAFELQIPMVASGPAFMRGVRLPSPSGNIDIAPTILHLLGLPIPESMEGRVLFEALRQGDAEPPVATPRRHRVTGPDGRGAKLQEVGAGGARYLQWISGTDLP